MSKPRRRMVAQIAAAVGDATLLAHLVVAGLVTFPLAKAIGTADSLRRGQWLRCGCRNDRSRKGIVPMAVDTLLSPSVSRNIRKSAITFFFLLLLFSPFSWKRKKK